jgi:hypothetical protein
LNLPNKAYILAVAIVLICISDSGTTGHDCISAAGLNFIALFAALFYGSVNGSGLLDRELSFFQYRHDNSLGNIFPIKGRVLKNVTLSGENDWLLVRLNNSFRHNQLTIEHVLIKRNDKQPIIPNKANQLVFFKLVPDVKMICEKENDKTDFPMEVWALCM